MGIILEGMDGSGKSTLAKSLNLHFPEYKIIHPGAPPKEESVETQFLDFQATNVNNKVIYDRVTCISQQVYRKKLLDERYMSYLRNIYRHTTSIIIYCRPPSEILLNMENNTVSEHDTPEMLEHVKKNADLFVASYDVIMSLTPHIMYNYTRHTVKDIVNHLLEIKGHRSW